MKQHLSDLVLDEIREGRRRISARFGSDPTPLVTFSMEMQKQSQDRLIEAAKGSQDRDNQQSDTTL